MATLSVRAKTFGTSSGSTWSTTANAVDGVFGATNSTYATFTSLVSGATGYIEVNFGTQISSVIPANATGISVSVTIRHLETNVTTMPTVRYQPYDGATAIGTIASGTASTSNHANTAAFTPTIGQLRSATFKVRVTCTRNASTTAGNFSLDNVDIVVTYTVPKMATLTESFATSTNWYTYAGAVITGGQLACAYTDTAYAGAGHNYKFDLTSSSIFYKVVIPELRHYAQETALMMQPSANNGIWTIITGDTTPALTLRVKVANVNTDIYVPYDAYSCAYLKVALSGTTVTWSKSPDGITWTVLSTGTCSVDMSNTPVEFTCGQWDGTGTAAAYFDSVNIPGVAVGGRPKVWTGAAWANKPAKVWSGTAWVEKPVKVWTGSVWKPAT